MTRSFYEIGCIENNLYFQKYCNQLGVPSMTKTNFLSSFIGEKC